MKPEKELSNHIEDQSPVERITINTADARCYAWSRATNRWKFFGSKGVCHVPKLPAYFRKQVNEALRKYKTTIDPAMRE